ncbi:MAG: hypothetical protein ACRDTD_26290, partial [Pseudonocardiaceae bacterium]
AHTAARAVRHARSAAVALATAATALALGACSASSPPPDSDASAAAGGEGQGVTSSEIKVGVVHLLHAEAGGGSSVDQKAQAQAVIDYVNSHGKVAGRTLVPVYQAVDLQKAAGGSPESTKACTALTEDTKVFAVLATAAIDNKCLIKHHTPIIASGLNASRDNADGSGYRGHEQYLYGPSALPTDDNFRVLIDGLAQQDFFSRMPDGASGSAKIGVVTFAQQKTGVGPALESALAEHDLKVTDYGLVENTGNSAPSIVLRFTREGITHVLFPNYSPVTFAPAAEAQEYRPLYGLSSSNVPGLIEKMLPAAQLKGAQGVGWMPFTDVGAQQETGLTGQSAQLCTKIMKDAHLPVTHDAMQSAAAYCDDFLVLQRSLQGAKSVTPQTLQHGYEAIGAWDSPAAFSAKLGPDRHAGVSGSRDLAFDAGCSCFRYQGPVRPIAAR